MSAFRIGDNEQVSLSQRSLMILFGAVVACALAYADLKHSLSDHEKAIGRIEQANVGFAAAQADAAKSARADHEVLLHIADQLRWAVKDQASHEHNPDRDMPKN